jgi:hypothetical protein
MEAQSLTFEVTWNHNLEGQVIKHLSTLLFILELHQVEPMGIPMPENNGISSVTCPSWMQKPKLKFEQMDLTPTFQPYKSIQCLGV